ncbi:uncharacterized protein LOC129958282 isoform X2 [Argiope bruennichi]|uniref:uncharacterized protein LOC129958282 isoform X2 n=1 Tax=Argiope bruennichi TaxID=94029 RepID=UPI002493E0F2|nr:uncharacterized protein LOC129958282 isoform X2 [Argiope bruennichi]
MKRKMWYNNRKIRKPSRNIKHPLVLAERNEKVAFLARKLAQQNKIDHEKYQQPNCSGIYKECHSEKESDHIQIFKFPSKMGEKLQDLNADGKENHIGKQPLIFDSQQDIETETVQNNDNDASTYASSKPCESLQYRLPVKCPVTAITEMDCIPFQLIDSNEHTDTRNALKEVIYDVSPECNPLSLNREIPLNMKHNNDASENKTFGATNEYNPPSLSREIPQSMEHIDKASENLSLGAANDPPTLRRETPLSIEYFNDASENKGCNAAKEEFFVIDEGSDSEKKSCVSYSEECSGADQQL